MCGAGRVSRPTTQSTVPTIPVWRLVGLEDRAQQERRRGLAVRPCDAGDGEQLGRRAEERVRGHRGRCAGRLDDELRHGDVDRPLDDERDGPRRDGLGCERVTVARRAWNADEERALADGARVVRQVEDLDGPPPDHLLRCERADERVETHQARL